MLRREVYTVLALVLAVFIVRVTGAATSVEKSPETPALHMSDLFDKSKITDHYPLAWVEIPYKPAIDNSRLFKKYKDCVLAAEPIGCPKPIKEMLQIAKEAIATDCAKCLPAHIKRAKEIAEYMCSTRRADFDEMRRVRDPDGAIVKAFEKKAGKLNC